MTDDTLHTISFTGCRPNPMAFYFKGLGIARILAEQLDPALKFRWHNEVLMVQTRFAAERIESFFLNDYAPSPVTNPWNGGSGYYSPNKSAYKQGLSPIKRSKDNRLAGFRSVISYAEETINNLNLTEKPDAKQKLALVRKLRERCSDEYLNWIDTSLLISDLGLKFPPLLGVGGNDGNLDFSSAFIQRITFLFNLMENKKRIQTDKLLKSALFETPTVDMQKAPIGQFYPGGIGGFNSSAGFSGDGFVNPWDFVLLIEGTLVFTAASHKRLASGQPGVLAAPFTVRPSSAGYGSATLDDSASGRAEIWLPLWSQWATLSEVRYLFSEGRCEIGRRKAATGVDFARAISGLGVSRGIDAFYRYGIHLRNGLAYLATPLGKWSVAKNPSVYLLNEIDGWLDRYRRAVRDQNVPGRISHAYESLENALLQFIRHDHMPACYRLAECLATAEAALANSTRFSADKFLRPLPMLSRRWLRLVDDGSVEFHIAAAAASIDPAGAPMMREHIEPVNFKGRYGNWAQDGKSMHSVYTPGSPVRGMIQVVMRRFLDAGRNGVFPLPVRSLHPAPLAAVNRFLEADFDPFKLDVLIRFCSLIDFKSKGHSINNRTLETILPPATYTVLKLCHLPFELDTQTIVHDPSIAANLYGGHLDRATEIAATRLRVSGLPPKISTTPNRPAAAHRYLASLLFGIGESDLIHLVRRDIKPDETQTYRQVTIKTSDERRAS